MVSLKHDHAIHEKFVRLLLLFRDPLPDVFLDDRLQHTRLFLCKDDPQVSLFLNVKQNIIGTNCCS
jgi:hypothetical protein